MKLLCLLCVVFFAGIQAKKLHLDVLYESLCPDSYRFIKNQLYPSWKDVSQFLEINFVPFGKSSSNGEEFECQHGPRECMGNKLQSCALNALDNQDTKVEFVYCFMKTFKKSKDETGEQCVTDAGLSWDTVKECYNSKQGTELQLEAEKLTAKYSPKFIPTFVYNEAYHQLTNDETFLNFKATVCSFQGIKCPIPT